MSGGWFSKIGSEEPIPPGEYDAEIGVLLHDLIGMMDAMHVRSDQEQAQARFEPLRKGHVRVDEKIHDDVRELQDQHGQWRRREDSDYRQINALRQQDFHGVKSQAR